MYIDCNKGRKCKNYYDVSSKGRKWRFPKAFVDPNSPHCSHAKQYKTINNPLETSRQGAMEDAVQALASNIGPNWIRIDMFDSKDHGPVLGEFTPSSTDGQASPLDGCVMSYLFIVHADYNGEPGSDDAANIRQLNESDVDEFKKKLRIPKTHTKGGDMKQSRFDFYPTAALEWSLHDELTKCEIVMQAQKQRFGAGQ